VAVSVATALLLGALFAGDSVWLALAAFAVAGAWGALALSGRAPLPRGAGPLLGATAAVAVWTGLSVAWSIAPDLSWAELNRTLVLAALLVVGLLLGAAGGSRACSWAAGALLVALGAAVLWALAGKVVPALFPDGDRAARLRDPIGYWNALALAADILLVLALWLARAAGASRPARAAGAVLAYGAIVAVLLTASRAGVAAGLVGVVLWLWLRRERVEAALLAVAVSVPAVAVAAWAFTRPALVEDGQRRADRVHDGAWFGLLLVAGAGVAVLLAHELDRRPLGHARRRTVGRVLVASAVVLVLAGGVAVATGAGGVADEFRGGEVTNDPGRLGSLSSNNRLAWWGEALDTFAANPLGGAGANTFEVARKRYRDIASAVTQPHSVPLQFLAGTGVIGVALLALLVAAAAAAAFGALRRSEGSERDAAAALAVALPLWLLHALVDYDWDFVAVTGPVLLAAGVLAASGRPARRRAMPLAAVGAGALAVAAALSVLTPWFAVREVRSVGAALDRGELDAAAEAANRARDLDPLSLEPLFAQALVAERRGDVVAALAAYREATRLQPENPESWLQLGLFEFHRGDRCSAYTHLNEAYTRDPVGRQWVEGGPLDLARDWVNAGNC
jgi:tetratricopeptide (TPR) repeat protein